ncbi:MAG: hypothetical protein JWO31_62 [Phycisphaerales bacterium]|nr:hypothetical protein [Phycisphaerales bacterium]
MTSAAAIPFHLQSDDAVDASSTWAYRRQARRLRDRFRHDAFALQASLKSLAAQMDAAAPPRPARRSALASRLVASRVVVPIGEPDSATGPARFTAWPGEPIAPFRRPRPSPPATDRVADPTADTTSSAAVGPAVRDVLNASPEAVDEFATLVRAALADGAIGYTRRQALNRRGDALRIGRFEASLIIAAVEHRHRTYAPTAAVTLPPVRRRTVGAVVAAVLLLEALALIALWVH